MAANQSDNQLRISWHDSAWISRLSGENVLDYFCQRSNPFYDRTCNNEVVKMQRLDPGQLRLMTGIEYELIHGQDPILYVIRKQERHSPERVTFISSYYILAGIVYQAPDLGSVLNSRLLSTIHNLELAFDEALSYSKYSPSKGYWWDFKGDSGEEKNAKKMKKKQEEPSSVFQRHRVDQLLSDFCNKFPPKVLQPQQQPNMRADDSSSIASEDVIDKQSHAKEPSLGNMEPPASSQSQQQRHNQSNVTSKSSGTVSPAGSQNLSRSTNPVGDNKPATPPTKKRKI